MGTKLALADERPRFFWDDFPESRDTLIAPVLRWHDLFPTGLHCTWQKEDDPSPDSVPTEPPPPPPPPPPSTR